MLDIGLPDISGLEVARRLRARGAHDCPSSCSPRATPCATACDGLDAGADDYLVKPFAYAGAVGPPAGARPACGRRGTDGTGRACVAGPIALDEARRHRGRSTAARSSSRAREFAVLECLLRHPDQVLSRDQLLDHAWPMGVAVTLNSVDAYVSFLRRKLGPEAGERIQTVRGMGYRLVTG